MLFLLETPDSGGKVLFLVQCQMKNSISIILDILHFMILIFHGRGTALQHSETQIDLQSYNAHTPIIFQYKGFEN